MALPACAPPFSGIPAPADAPLTPDGDEAQSWVGDELSRPEYGSELSPLTRAIRWVLQTVVDAFTSGSGHVPVGSIVLAAFAVILVILVAVVAMNPVRLRRRAPSGAVFDGEDRSLEDCLAAARAAAGDGRWDDAVIWYFRALVLTLAGDGAVHDGPGLTAREASAQAQARRPDLREDLAWAAGTFDALRYGAPEAARGGSSPDAPATAGPGDVDRLRALIDRAGRGRGDALVRSGTGNAPETRP
jgi:hypothetical protein